MLNLLDQYENTMRSKKPVISSENKTAPIFSRKLVNFTPTSPITHMVAASNQLVIAMANKQLLRVDLLNPNAPIELDLLKETTGSRIQHVFLSPSAGQLLVSTVSREGDLTTAALYHISGVKSNRVRSVGQMKGQLVTAVGWPPAHPSCKVSSGSSSTSSSTGPLLLGNSVGVVTEINLSADESFFSRLEIYVKRVFEASEGQSVCAVSYHRLPERRYFVLVVTATRLYQFHGTATADSNSQDRPLLTSVFSQHSPSVPEQFREIPSSWPFSRLALFAPTPTALPTHFAWMTEPGILYGEFELSGEQPTVGATCLISHHGASDDTCSAPRAAARSVALTQFHVLALSGSRVRAVSVLNQRCMYEDTHSPEVRGAAVTLARDAHTGVLWCAAERAVYRYNVLDETRYVWQILVEKELFTEARRCCQHNPAILAKIISSQAEKSFNEKKYIESAEIYAESACRLEEVALKFITCGQLPALRLFLRSRLESLDPLPRLVSVLLVVWSAELFLSQLDTISPTTASFAELHEEMMDFLTQDLKQDSGGGYRAAIYKLICRHGYSGTAAQLAARLSDYSVVVKHQLNNGNITEALSTLTEHPDPDLLYGFVTELIGSEPAAAVDLIVAQSRQLNPSKLVPKLLLANTSPVQGVEIVRYLEHCVCALASRDPVVHNYLVTLYVQHRPDKLMQYLRSQGLDRSEVCYTPAHVLRQCWLTQPLAAVYVLCVVGRQEEAVALALKHDVTVAKQVANSRQDDDALRKRLWLLIAKHTVHQDQSVERTMHFLRECPLLRIEDVLPFFPDFVSIDQFKDSICASLQTYNEHIGELQTEMDEAACSTDMLRDEISALTRRHVPLPAASTCHVCGHMLLTRAVYVFPCRHTFHQDCLTGQLRPRLSQSDLEMLSQLQTRLSSVADDDRRPLSSTASPAADDDVTAAGASAGRAAALRAQLDELLASQCLYCGDYLIGDVDDLLMNDFPGLQACS